jgi:hypothetical protein
VLVLNAWLLAIRRRLNGRNKYFHISGVQRRIKRGFWFGWLDLLIFSFIIFLFTINYSATVNLPTSQISRIRYPCPGNGLIRGTITSNHYEVFLPFLVQSPWNADPPELDPVLRFQFCNPAFLKLFWSGDHFYKSEQFCGPPYSCSLRKQICHF